MTGLNQIRTAVLSTLTDAGLTAVAAWDGAAKRYDGAVIAVDAAEVSGRPMALGGYLGEIYDSESGTVRELYGRQLDVALSLDVRAPGAAACESACEAASDALEVGGLPSGLRPGEQKWEGIVWDAENRMFLRRGTVRCRAWFTAGSDPETGALLDFTLKGVLTT